jgi:hypothetical protein
MGSEYVKKSKRAFCFEVYVSNMYIGAQMIDKEIVERVDEWLDNNVDVTYKRQPMAQDWARICKGIEEMGETVAELILMTGQNPRKPRNREAFTHMLNEMADTALTFIYGIQHFTKNINWTEEILINAQKKNFTRASE